MMMIRNYKKKISPHLPPMPSISRTSNMLRRTAIPAGSKLDDSDTSDLTSQCWPKIFADLEPPWQTQQLH